MRILSRLSDHDSRAAHAITGEGDTIPLASNPGRRSTHRHARRSEVEAAKRKKEAYTNPCPKCGYIDEDSQKMIDAQNARIASCEADITKAQAELKDLVQPKG